MLQITAMTNYFKSCLQPYFVRSSNSDTIEVNELIDIMAQWRTTLTKPDISGCLQLFSEELIKLVADGKHVKTPVGSFYLSASGRLETRGQSFTPGVGPLDHELKLHFRTNKGIEAKMKSQARWERVETFDTSSAVIDGCAVVARAAGEAAHAGDTVRIMGHRMKFDFEDLECGVFLENEAVSSRCPVYAYVTPSNLIATLPPDLPAGAYDLLVVTKPNGKDLKTGCFDKPFTVAA